MTEAELQRAIVEAAELGGWLWYHVPDSRRAPAGFPDLVLLRPPELLLIECKAAKGRVSDAQRAWLEAFDAVEVISAGVIRPDDLEAIQRRLTARPNSLRVL